MKDLFMRSMLIPVRLMSKWWADWDKAYQDVMEEIKRESEDSRGNK